MFEQRFLASLELLRDKVESWNDYPFSIPAIQKLDQLQFGKEVTFFIGDNGSGKSTLLEALAVAMGFNAEGGSKNFSFATRRSHSDLHKSLRIARGIRRPRTGYFLRAESFFNVATQIEELDRDVPPIGLPIIQSYGGRSLHEQSHGESFWALLMNRFGEDGLYFLDEPEAALSPRRQLAALVRIHDLVAEGCQFVIATHSPILMAYPGATLYVFNEEGIAPTDYRDTEHFRITSDFLANPERMLRILFQDDSESPDS